MSAPRSPRGRSALLAVAALAVAVVVVVALAERSRAAAARPAPAPAAPILPAPAHAQAARGGTASRVPGSDAALARAYAAAGVAADGGVDRTAALDAAAAACLDQARVLLAAQARIRGEGRAIVFPGGSMRVPAAPADAGGTGAPSPGAAPAAGASEASPARPPLGAAHSQRPFPVRGDAEIKDLVEPDAFIAIPFDPAAVAGRPLTIRNRSGGEYGLRLIGDDFGSVRLDGGLAVPGRFYRIDRETRIESAVPVGVEIRPLAALPAYYAHPARPPQEPVGNG